MNSMDSGSQGGCKETSPIIDDPQCVQAQWESFLKINPSTNIHRVFLMLKSPAGRTHFSTGDKWMFLGNAISYPVCVPVFHQPLQAHSHLPPCSSRSIPSPDCAPSNCAPSKGSCNGSCRYFYHCKEEISPVLIQCLWLLSYFVLSEELTILCPCSQLSPHPLPKGDALVSSQEARYCHRSGLALF